MLSEIVEYAWSCFEVQSVGDRLKWLVVLSIVWNSLKLARLFSKRPVCLLSQNLKASCL